MPIRTTFADLQNSGVGDTLNLPPCNARFIALANRAQRTLADAGRWYGTIVVMRFCQYNGCITFPRDVAVVEKMDICRESVYIRNQWWEFQTDYPVPPVGQSKQQQQGWTPELLPRNNVCTFQDVTGSPAYIQLYPQSAADVGKIILLQGIDSSTLQPVQESVTLTLPYAQSAYQYLPPGLTGVQKPVTVGQINVTAYYPTSTQSAPIAIWEASETDPWYIRRYLLNFPTYCASNAPVTGGNCCTDYGTGCATALTNCQNGIAATFLVRREFVPVLVATDWMFIQNIEAVREEMMALNSRDQHQFDLASQHHAIAIQLLRNELDKYQPPQQITVNCQPWGDAHPRRVFGAFI